MKTIIIDDDEVSGKMMEHYVSKTEFMEFVQHFTSPVKALSFLSSNPVDLVLLDIEMPEMSGMELMNAIKNLNRNVILVTSHKEFAIEAFEYNVVDYLVKPFTYPRFFKAVSIAKERNESRSVVPDDDDFVFVKKDNRIIQIRKSEIIWVEAMGDY